MVKRLYQADSKETFIKRGEYAFSNEGVATYSCEE
jgi:hypothetical protein